MHHSCLQMLGTIWVWVPLYVTALAAGWEWPQLWSGPGSLRFLCRASTNKAGLPGHPIESLSNSNQWFALDFLKVLLGWTHMAWLRQELRIFQKSKLGWPWGMWWPSWHFSSLAGRLRLRGARCTTDWTHGRNATIMRLARLDDLLWPSAIIIYNMWCTICNIYTTNHNLKHYLPHPFWLKT